MMMLRDFSSITFSDDDYFIEVMLNFKLTRKELKVKSLINYFILNILPLYPILLEFVKRICNI